VVKDEDLWKKFTFVEKKTSVGKSAKKLTAHKTFRLGTTKVKRINKKTNLKNRNESLIL